MACNKDSIKKNKRYTDKDEKKWNGYTLLAILEISTVIMENSMVSPYTWK